MVGWLTKVALVKNYSRNSQNDLKNLFFTEINFTLVPKTKFTQKFIHMRFIEVCC